MLTPTTINFHAGYGGVISCRNVLDLYNDPYWHHVIIDVVYGLNEMRASGECIACVEFNLPCLCWPSSLLTQMAQSKLHGNEVRASTVG